MNGHRLLGMNHIEVVTILKELPMAVRMVCARRNGDGNALRLIDTSQDRAAFAARVIFFLRACLSGCVELCGLYLQQGYLVHSSV